MKMKLRIITTLSILTMFFIVGCAAKKAPRKKQGEMDTPAFHTQRGDDMLLRQDFISAERAYERALSLKSDYSPALSGKAVTTAHTAKESGEESKIKTGLESMEALIEKASDSAQSKKQKIRVHSYAVQAHWALQFPEDEWFEKVESHFEEAIDLDPMASAPYFFMAGAESARFNYAAASAHYNKVLELKGVYAEEANRKLEIVQKIQRAKPGSRNGKTIAWIPKISRADVAALFIDELRLERLYQDVNAKKAKGFKKPKNQQDFKPELSKGELASNDIEGHPMQSVIETILKLGVRGLENDPTASFHPDQKITRAEFALMIQDVLVKVSRDRKIETQFIGETSPFPDVRPDMYYYNAARVVVSRNLMQVKRKATGEFGPGDPVLGADALLVLRDLKEMLMSYTR